MSKFERRKCHAAAQILLSQELYTAWELVIYLEVEEINIGEILQAEVNSAMITVQNHDNDNGFLECGIREFTLALRERNYEPIGICKNVPFKPTYTEYAVAFCYKRNDEIYWCHLTETMWYSLLTQLYGRKKADTIISKIMGY